jgi:putative heme-binding domain-containing protein
MRRMLAADELVDNIGQPALDPVRKSIVAANSSPFQRVHGMWILKRLGALDDRMVAAAAHDASELVRVHAMHVSADLFTPTRLDRLTTGLKDPNAFVERAAADALGQKKTPSVGGLPELLELLRRAPTNDTHLRYVGRMALRDRLGEGTSLVTGSSAAAAVNVYQALQKLNLTEQDLRNIAAVSVAVKTPEAGSFLLQHLRKFPEDPGTTARYLSHAARFAPDSDMDSLAEFTRTKFADDLDFQSTLFQSVQQGTAQRGAELSAGCRAWGAELAAKLLPALDDKDLAWQNIPIEGMADQTSPWFIQKRKSSDGDSDSLFVCSLPPKGEQLTGILRSRAFVIPASLSFYLAGHNGLPNTPDKKKNVVRLRSAATGDVIAEAWPPRNDVAKPANWDLSKHAGEQGYLEIIDADNGKSYAWLAAGRFSPAVVPLPLGSVQQIALRQREVADLAASLKIASLEPQLAKILASPSTDLETRAAVAKAMVVLNPSEYLTALAPLVGDSTVPGVLRNRIADTLASRDSKQSESVLTDALRDAPYRVQVKLAQTLAGSPAGAENLLQLIERGQAAPRLLAERTVTDRLASSKPANAAARIEKLTRGLAPANEVIEQLLATRRAGFKPNRSSAAEGAKIFAKNCAVCHQLDGQGAVVGPQLDGIGARGLERLSEDVLDPNRNVDRAFRNHIITLVDGDVISGLPRREEGEVLVLADSTGKEMSIPKKNIKDRRESETSLMPENFGEVLSQDDFNHLMAFLLTKNGRPQK